MIFDHKFLSEILNEDIEQLVSDHIFENKNLEYKCTINYKTDEEKYEALCDIVSLANAGGGYLIVGIRDDGKGRAQKFENVERPEQLTKSIQALCIEYISERIDGIEYDIRSIQDNQIIIYRIPESLRIPHMVTYKNQTHFVTRYIEGKREMSIGEIRAAFINDIVGMKLAHVEDGINKIIKNQNIVSDKALVNLIASDEISDLTVENGDVISKANTDKFIKMIDKNPFFRISITPKIAKRSFLNISTDVKKAFEYHPDDRNYGWNMTSRYLTTKILPDGLSRSETGNDGLVLKQNGYMEFYTAIDPGFCWTQPVEEFKKRPRFYPYPVIEYPYSFLRLYKSIIEIAKVEDTNFIITAGYYNIEGAVLYPYHPSSIAYGMQHNHTEPYKKDNLVIPTLEVKRDFNVDNVNYDIVKYVYGSFGYDESKIPMVKNNNGHIKFMIV